MNNNKLKDLRIAMNLTQKDVAEILEITTSYYGMLELGKRKPDINLAYKIANFFHSTIEEIFFSNTNNLSLSQRTA